MIQWIIGIVAAAVAGLAALFYREKSKNEKLKNQMARAQRLEKRQKSIRKIEETMDNVKESKDAYQNAKDSFDAFVERISDGEPERAERLRKIKAYNENKKRIARMRAEVQKRSDKS